VSDLKSHKNVSTRCVSTVLSELNPVLADPQVQIFVVSFVISTVFMTRQLVFIHTFCGDPVLQMFVELTSPLGVAVPSGAEPARYRVFTITLRHTTSRRTPLDE